MTGGLGWWLAKAVVSGIYWVGAAYLILPLMFGDRVGADGAIMPGPPAWVGWAAVIAAIFLWATVSMLINRWITRRASG